MRKALIGGICLVVFAGLLTVSGCKKKQEEVAPQQMPPMPPVGQGQQMGMPQKIETVLQVPEDVKKKWKAIKLNVTDKTTNKSSIVSVEIGKESQIPGTDLKVFVEAFLPAFKMDGGTITSTSPDQTTNPAAKIKVSEKGQDIFSGWLFELYPTVHPFTHPKYTITLAGYDKK